MKLILNLITTAITVLLMVLTIYSWYVSNREVSATGISASTVEDTPIVDSVVIYSFGTKNSSNVYPVKQYSDTDVLTMVYNPNFELEADPELGMKLIEINFVDGGVDLSKVTITTAVQKFIGYGNYNNWVTAENIAAGLSLTCVTRYIVLEASDVGFNAGKTTATFSNLANYSFENYAFDSSTGSIDNTYKDLLSTTKEGINSIYILVDFYDTAIDKLFSDNIGNTVMDDVLYDDTKNLTFKCDFKFLLIGEEVAS